jgi:uncharacterized protein YdhG (YjbR/CyaY superfamily)
MPEKKQPPKDVDGYIAGVSPRFSPALAALRAVIRSSAPDAEEIIRMGTPTYLHHGNLVSFSAAATHCAFYVMSAGPIERYRDALRDFDTAPTAIRFQPEAPIPEELVAAIVRDRMRENEARKK